MNERLKDVGRAFSIAAAITLIGALGFQLMLAPGLLVAELLTKSPIDFRFRMLASMTGALVVGVNIVVFAIVVLLAPYVRMRVK